MPDELNEGGPDPGTPLADSGTIGDANVTDPSATPAGEQGGGQEPDQQPGVMLQADYTQKTQRLAEQKRELDARAQQLAGLQEFAQLVENTPGLAEEIEQVMTRKLSGPRPAPKPTTTTFSTPQPSTATPDYIERLNRNERATFELQHKLNERELQEWATKKLGRELSEDLKRKIYQRVVDRSGNPYIRAATDVLFEDYADERVKKVRGPATPIPTDLPKGGATTTAGAGTLTPKTVDEAMASFEQKVRKLEKQQLG